MSKPENPHLKVVGIAAFLLLSVGAAGFYWNGQASSEASETDHSETDSAELVKEKRSTGTAVLTNTKVLVSSDQHLIRPKFSPDGKKILFSTQGNKGLYFISADEENSKTIELSSADKVGYGAHWSADGTKVFYNEKDDKYQNHVKSIAIDNSEITQYEDVHFSAIQSYTSTNGEGPILTLDMNTLNIFAEIPSTGKKWLVTTEEGRYYQHILSPDRSKVLVHSGQDMMVFNADGSGRYSMLGKAVGTCWSPDSKYILAHLDESPDGHEMTNSDIYLYKADGSQSWKITDTPDRFEMWATWGADEKTIVYSDAETGIVYSAILELN